MTAAEDHVAAAEVLPGWQPAPGARCAKCGINPVGPGGIICPDCRDDIEAALPGGAERSEPPAPGDL